MNLIILIVGTAALGGVVWSFLFASRWAIIILRRQYADYCETWKDAKPKKVHL
jgi:hypothetical protein